MRNTQTTPCSDCAARLKCFVAGLAQKEYDELKAYCQLKTAPAGKIIYYENTPANAFYMLVEGKVKLQHFSAFDQPITLNIVHPDEYFGIGAFLPDRNYFMQASAITAVKYCRFTQPLIEWMLKHDPRHYLDLIGSVYQQKYKILGFAFLLVGGTPRARVAFILLMLAGDNSKVSVPKDELAYSIGLARETVSRILSKFIKAGYIKFEKHDIAITNGEELELLSKERKNRYE